MSLEQEIRDQIERNKELKQEVGYINNHLSILEGFCRDDKQNQVDDAYKRGFEDGKNSIDKGCEGCKWESKKGDEEPCMSCSNAFPNKYEPMPKDDSIKVGDEVIWKTNDIALIVTSAYESGGFEWCDGVAQDGKVYHTLAENNKKTGKHYDIQSILGAMQYDPQD